MAGIATRIFGRPVTRSATTPAATVARTKLAHKRTVCTYPKMRPPLNFICLSIGLHKTGRIAEMERMTVGHLREALAAFADDMPIRAEAISGGANACIGAMRVVDEELEIDIE